MQYDIKRLSRTAFVLKAGLTEYLFSYDTIIACRTGDRVELDSRYWNYSQATGNARNAFLGENIAATRKKIESGEYILKDLNNGGENVD